MKKILYFTLAAALSAAALVSCNKIIEDEINNDDPQVVDPEVDQPAAPIVETLTFAIQGDEATKAYLSDGSKKHCVWDNGDKIGTIVTAGDAGYSTVDASTTPVTFSVKNTGGFVAGKTIYAWFPYGTKKDNPANVGMTIPVEQYMNGTSFDFSAMPMTSKGITITEEMVRGTADQTTVDVIAFYNLASLIDFRIFASSSYTTERVLSVTFNADDNIAGDFSKDLTAVNPENESTLTISGYSETSITTTLPSEYPLQSRVGTSGSPLDVYMVVAPGSHSGQIVVVTDAATYTWTISSAKDFVRSHVKPLGLQLDGGSASRVENVKGYFDWDLSKATYDSVDENDAIWSHSFLTMHNAKNTGSSVNGWIPPTKGSTRFYTNNILSFTNPGIIQIDRVELTATSDSYASALADVEWTNANVSSASTLATIIPIDGSADFSAKLGGTTGCTNVKVYYDNTNYSITGSSSPISGGSFTIKKGASDVTEAKVNTTITLNPVPNSGYLFSSWTVEDAEHNVIPVVANEFQMPASAVTITANFIEEASTKTISIDTPSNGTVSTSPEGAALPGTTVTITATPNEGYAVESVRVEDEDEGTVTVTSNQFTMPSKNVTVKVTFVRVYYSVVFNNTTNQSGVNSYTSSFNTISDGITVACQNFNNNNSAPGKNGTWTYIQAGAKKDGDITESTGTLTTSSSISAVIRKVVVPLTILRGSATGKLYVASDSSFTTNLQTIDLGALSTRDAVFSIPAPAASQYYKLEFVCSNNTGTNGVVKVTGIQYSLID